MAHSQRTYEWVNGRIEAAKARQPHERMLLNDLAKPRPFMKPARTTGLDLQTGLLVFTCSSVVMIFAGSALIFVLFVIYSVLFG